MTIGYSNLSNTNDFNSGKKIKVQPWASNKNDDNCLSNIMSNHYGDKLNDENYDEIEKKIMEANPQIYGEENGGWREEVGGEGRQNAVLYDGETLILPELDKEEPEISIEPEVPPQQEPEEKTNEPKPEVPSARAPETPKTDEPKTEAPSVQTPETPKPDEQKPETPTEQAPETPKPDEAEKVEESVKAEDEFDYSVDDGIISPKDKLINFGKGLVSPITSMFDSVENFAIGAGMIAGGAALIYATGGLAAPVLAVAGLMYGVYELGTSAYNAHNAQTDKEAQEAWQGIGAGTSFIGLSALGAKGSSKGPKDIATKFKNNENSVTPKPKQDNINPKPVETETPLETENIKPVSKEEVKPVETEEPIVSEEPIEPAEEVASEPEKIAEIEPETPVEAEKPVIEEEITEEPIKPEEITPIKPTETETEVKLLRDSEGNVLSRYSKSHKILKTHHDYLAEWDYVYNEKLGGLIRQGVNQFDGSLEQRLEYLKYEKECKLLYAEQKKLELKNPLNSISQEERYRIQSEIEEIENGSTITDKLMVMLNEVKSKWNAPSENLTKEQELALKKLELEATEKHLGIMYASRLRQEIQILES